MDLGDPRVPQFFWLDLPHSVWAKLRAMIQILEFPYLWRRSALCSFGRAGRNRPSSLAAVVRLRFVGSPAWLPRAVDKGQIADQQIFSSPHKHPLSTPSTMLCHASRSALPLSYRWSVSKKKKKGGISGAKSIMYAILRRGNATLKHFHRYATAAGPFVELISVKH